MKQCPMNGEQCDRADCADGNEFQCGAQAFARPAVDVMPRPPSGERHLGDGLYASFDGFQFKLRAPRGDGDHEVYLEPSVLQAFLDYAKLVGVLR